MEMPDPEEPRQHGEAEVSWKTPQAFWFQNLPQQYRNKPTLQATGFQGTLRQHDTEGLDCSTCHTGQLGS